MFDDYEDSDGMTPDTSEGVSGEDVSNPSGASANNPIIQQLIEQAKPKKKKDNTAVQSFLELLRQATQGELQKNNQLDATLNNTFTQGGKIRSAQDDALQRFAQQYGGSYDPTSGKTNLGIKGTVAAALNGIGGGMAAGRTGQPYVSPQDALYQKALADLAQQRQSGTLLMNNRSNTTTSTLAKIAAEAQKNSTNEDKADSDASSKEEDRKFKYQQLGAQNEWKKADAQIKQFTAVANATTGAQRAQALQMVSAANAAKAQAEADFTKMGKGNPLAVSLNATKDQGEDPFSEDGIKKTQNILKGLTGAKATAAKTPLAYTVPPGSPQLEGMDQPLTFDQLRRMDSARKELNSDKTVQEYSKILAPVQLVNHQLEQDPTSLSDLNLIETYAQAINGMRSVRGYQLENVKKTVGMFPRLNFLLDKGMDADAMAEQAKQLGTGRYLTDDVRTQIVNTINHYYNSLRDEIDGKVGGKATRIAKEIGASPDAVKNHLMLEYGPALESKLPEQSKQQYSGQAGIQPPTGMSPVDQQAYKTAADTKLKQDITTQLNGLKQELANPAVIKDPIRYKNLYQQYKTLKQRFDQFGNQ